MSANPLEHLHMPYFIWLWLLKSEPLFSIKNFVLTVIAQKFQRGSVAKALKFQRHSFTKGSEISEVFVRKGL